MNREKASKKAFYSALAGAFFGLGSPTGLFLYRLAAGHASADAAGLAAEWNSFSHVYIYTALGTVLAFSIFGWVLGRINDQLDAQLADLRRLSAELERLAVMDGLTGALVRRRLMERLEEELARSKRSTSPLACLFVDVDNLKGINDRHGHLAGDKALTMVSAALQMHLREVDVLGRYGGDEFVAILPDTGIEEAKACAERIRREVALMSLPTEEGPHPLSVSVGVHAARASSGGTGNFLKTADDALHRAKESGRNRVEGESA